MKKTGIIEEHENPPSSMTIENSSASEYEPVVSLWYFVWRFKIAEMEVIK